METEASILKVRFLDDNVCGASTVEGEGIMLNRGGAVHNERVWTSPLIDTWYNFSSCNKHEESSFLENL